MKSWSGMGGFRKAVVSLLALVALMTVVTGCGTSAPPANVAADLTDDQKAIKGLVDGFADYTSSAERAKGKFVKGKAPKPADVKKYANCSFSVIGDIVVSGETASATVEVLKTDTKTYTQTGTQHPWKFAKEGGEWKLAEAPAS